MKFNGIVIFSDLAVSQEFKDSYSGASIFYIWLRENPLYTNESIENGMGTLTVVGELEGVPAQWQFIPNYRCTFPIEIRKNLLGADSPTLTNVEHKLECIKGQYSFVKASISPLKTSRKGLVYGTNGHPAQPVADEPEAPGSPN